MTYRELLGYAQKKIDNNEITVGEYVEMTKVLNREVDVLDKIRAEIEELPKTYPFINHIDTYVKEDDVKKIIDKYRNKVGE